MITIPFTADFQTRFIIKLSAPGGEIAIVATAIQFHESVGLRRCVDIYIAQAVMLKRDATRLVTQYGDIRRVIEHNQPQRIGGRTFRNVILADTGDAVVSGDFVITPGLHFVAVEEF